MRASYETLARYDELSRSGPARCISDIRLRHREELQHLRLETRHVQRLKIRHLYFENYQSEGYESDQEDYPPGSYDTVDGAGSDCCDPADWFTGDWCNQQQPSGAASPSLSSESDWSRSSYSGSPSPVSSRSRKPRSRRELLKERKRVHNTYLEPERIQREYQSLKSLIVTSQAKPELVTIIASARWQSIARAIESSDQDLVRDALNLLYQLVTFRLIKISDMLSILQQGLLITLKNSMNHPGNCSADTMRLIVGIVGADPGAAPYIIEMMSNTGFLDMFAELVHFGSTEDTRMVVQFYSSFFQVLCDLSVRSEFTPTVPASVAANKTSTELAQVYDPRAMLRRIIKPNLMNPLVNWLFKHIGQIDCGFFRAALAFSGNSLKYVLYHTKNMEPDFEWVCAMMDLFQDSQLDTFIGKSIESGAIEQYPSSVRQEVRQFQDFYKLWTIEISRYLPATGRE